MHLNIDCYDYRIKLYQSGCEYFVRTELNCLRFAALVLCVLGIDILNVVGQMSVHCR